MLIKAPKRKLGFWETIKVFTHDLFNGSDIIVIDLQFAPRINIKFLRQALSLGFDRHPLLRASISQEEGCYWFNINLNFDQIPFNIFEEFSGKELHKVIEEEMQTTFPIENYLWRITVLQSTHNEVDHLILSFHHAMCDGTSLFSFIDEFLAYYAQVENGEIPTLHSLELYPPQENFLPKKINWTDYLNNATRYQDNPSGWKFHKNNPISKRYTRFLVKQLPISLIKNLAEICEKKKVSLNSFFNALSLITKQQFEGKRVDGVLWSWANTRSFCDPPVPAMHFGYFVNAVATRHASIDEHTNIWELAEDYHNELKRALPNLAYFPGYFTNEQVMNYYNMDKIPHLTHFFYDFTLSYLDQLPLKKQYGSLKIENLQLAVNINSGIAGAVLEIFTFSDHISFCCCYAEPLVDKVWIEQYMKKFEGNIRMIVDKEN